MRDAGGPPMGSVVSVAVVVVDPASQADPAVRLRAEHPGIEEFGGWLDCADDFRHVIH